MANLVKIIMLLNVAIVIIQLCVLCFQINRLNEIIGSIFSIVISLMGYFPASLGEGTSEHWFLVLYAFMLAIDFIFQLVNMILLICLQWVAVQYCLNMNVSIDISYYGGIACYDWWHFDWGEINHRDRAVVVTVLFATVIILRIAQIALSLVKTRPRTSEPMFFVSRDADFGTTSCSLHNKTNLQTG